MEELDLRPGEESPTKKGKTDGDEEEAERSPGYATEESGEVMVKSSGSPGGRVQARLRAHEGQQRAFPVDGMLRQMASPRTQIHKRRIFIWTRTVWASGFVEEER